MVNIGINNVNANCHYETIESIIVKYNELLNIEKNENDKIFLNLHKYADGTFINYIKSKYKNIFVGVNINQTHYKIIVTAEKYHHNTKNTIFIMHNYNEHYDSFSNVIFLSAFSKKPRLICDVLPFSDIKIKTDIPIYIIQGSLTPGRRNYNLLLKLINKKYELKFKIILLGAGNPPKIFYKNRNINIVTNKNFIDYHEYFKSCYGIFTLVDKKKYNQYYTTKLTSTINYAIGYDLKCIIDNDLQDIYKLTNVETYEHNDNGIDFIRAFEKTLKDFYDK